MPARFRLLWSMVVGVVSSLRKLAEKVGAGVSVVREWVKRPDWQFSRAGPWSAADVDGIKRWRSMLQEDRSGAGGPPPVGHDPSVRFQIETLLKKYKADLARLQVQILEGKLVDRRLLNGALGGLTRMFVQVLEDLQASLPLKLAGQEAAAVEETLGDAFTSARQRVIQQGTIELGNVQSAIEAEHQKKAKGRPTAGGRR